MSEKEERAKRFIHLLIVIIVCLVAFLVFQSIRADKNEELIDECIDLAERCVTGWEICVDLLEESRFDGYMNYDEFRSFKQ